MLRGHKRNLVYTRKPYRLSQNCLWALECLLQRYGSAVACCRHRGSECSRPGYDITLSEEVAINPTIEPPELTQDLGNRLLEGTNKTLYVPGPRRKEQCTRNWPRDAHECPGVSGGGMGKQWPGLGWRHWVQQWVHGTFWRRSPLSSLPPPWFGLRSSNRREHSPTHQQKIGLKIYWTWPHPSE